MFGTHIVNEKQAWLGTDGNSMRDTQKVLNLAS